MINYKNIPSEKFDLVCSKYEHLPFKLRGINVTKEHIKALLEILNAEPSKSLPQNCRNERAEKTPDGLDRRMKTALHCDTRTANIVSDFLSEKGVVEIFQKENPKTGRNIKWTRLCPNWTW